MRVGRGIAAALAGLAANAALAQAPSRVPSPLAAPGDEVVLRLAGAGVQVYECRPGSDGPAWTFREPRAELSLEGRPVGRHFAGPSWEYADGSRVVGRVVASLPAPGPGDIPWLRLAVVSHAGAGALASVTAVQRLDTRGGVLVGACEMPGAVAEVPYTAEYVMLRAAP